MKNKIIKPMLIIASLTIGLGLSSCKKECWSEFKKEFSACDTSSVDTVPNPTVNN